MSYLDKLKDIAPYVAGEQIKGAKLIKLNTNENPYDPGVKVREVLRGFNTTTLKLYPTPDSIDLKKALSTYLNVKENQIFIGNGSDDVLALAFQTCFNSDLPVLCPDITYSFYPVWCDLFQIPLKRIPLNEKFEINTNDYKQENGGVVIANPNAPTGLLLGLDAIEEIVSNNMDSIVIVDEAYIDFGGTSTIGLIDKYPNLLVVQTFSKFRALAGMRIGYAVGSKEVISKLNDVKNSFNSYPVDTLAQLVGVASIEDSDYVKKNARMIIKTRDYVKEELLKMGFEVTDSKANFLFVKHKKQKAEVIYTKLKKKNILVRWFNQDRIDNYLRITIGTQDQMNDFLKALKHII